MVNIADKAITRREATASVSVCLNAETFAAVRDNSSSKGDVLTVAKLAGIQAAKKTADLIPLCHSVALDQVEIGFELLESSHSITITATAICVGRTGVEMEALTACSLTALTIYDMLKAIQRDIKITDLQLLEKSGGASGSFKNKTV